MSRSDGLIRRPDGDLVPEPDEPHRCADGWLGEDSEGRPRPCPECRPHLHHHTTPGGPTYLTARTDRPAPA